jgi:hypothetical protein
MDIFNMEENIFNPKEERSFVITKENIALLSDDERLAIFEAQCKSIGSVKDILKRKFLIKKLASLFWNTLGFNEKDIRDWILLSEREEERAKFKRLWSLQDIVDHDVTSASDILPGVFRDGGLLYIFGGKAKTGKTILLYYIASCIVQGKECLGRPVKRGKVDIFQLEEPPGLFVKRLQEGGLDKDQPIIKELIDNDYLRVHTDFNITTDLQWLKDYLLERKPRLVIVDSFRAATRDSEVSENSADFGKYAYALQRIASITGVTIVVIHHLNKSADPSKGADGLSGTGSLAGANDGMVFLYPGNSEYKTDECTHVVELLTIPREGIPCHLVIGRDPYSNPHGYWEYKVLDELNVDPDIVKFSNRILSVLCRHVNELLSKHDLAQKLGIDSSNKPFNFALSRLVEGCQINRTKERTNTGTIFYYGVDDNNPWPSYFKGSRAMINDLADKATRITTEQEAKDFVGKLTRSEQASLWDALEESERNRFLRLYNPPKFIEGQWVRNTEGDILLVTKVEFCNTAKVWNFYCDNSMDKSYTADILSLETNYSEAAVL